MSHTVSALQTFHRSGRFAKLRGVIRLFEVSTRINTDRSAAWSQRSNARKASSLCHTSQQKALTMSRHDFPKVASLACRLIPHGSPVDA